VVVALEGRAARARITSSVGSPAIFCPRAMASASARSARICGSRGARIAALEYAVAASAKRPMTM
jgi:hypothetical protein